VIATADPLNQIQTTNIWLELITLIVYDILQFLSWIKDKRTNWEDIYSSCQRVVVQT